MKLEKGVPPPAWVSRLVISLVVLSLVTAWAGDLLLAAVVKDNPLLLVALNPRSRNLALAAPQVDPVPYYVVGFLRLVASDPLYFLLGFWYGDRALAWVKRRSRTYGPLVDDAHGVFKQFAYPLIFLAPNNIICLLSGAVGVRIRTFFILNVSGTLVRLYLARAFGEIFSNQVNWVVDFISEYRIPILIISAIAVAWTVFGEFRGDNTELKTLLDLEEHPEGVGPDDVDPETTSSEGTTEGGAEAAGQS